MKKGQVDITTVLSAVLESKSKATSKGKVQDKSQDDDAVEIEDWENALDEQAAHSMKMKKWATIAWNSIQDPVFWLLIEVAHKSRGPLTHFYSFLLKNSEDSILLLIGGEAARIASEFDIVYAEFQSEAFWNKVVKDTGCDTLPDGVLSQLQALSLQLVLLHASGFDRRVVRPLSRQDRKLCSPVPFLHT